MHFINRLSVKAIFFFVLFGLQLVTASLLDALSLSGKEVADKVHDRYVGDNSIAKVTMQLVSEDGQVRTRKLTMITQDKDELRKTFVRFTEPADIAGTGFLSLEDSDGDTDQFLYLPALKRTRRIVSSQKGRSFVNTDFTYEDMERRPVEEFDHVVTGIEALASLECRVLVSTPQPEAETEYSKIKSWIPKDIFLPVRAEFFNDQGRHIKTYTVQSLEKVQDIWTPVKVTMHDLADNHSTIMHITQIEYNTDVQDPIFTKRYLERW